VVRLVVLGTGGSPPPVKHDQRLFLFPGLHITAFGSNELSIINSNLENECLQSRQHHNQRRAMLAVSAFQPVAGVMEEFEGPILSVSSPDRGSSTCDVR